MRSGTLEVGLKCETTCLSTGRGGFSTGVCIVAVQAASKGCSRGGGEECLVNCDDHFPSPWIHWLRAVIFTQTALLTMFTTINPVTIHGSLVTVRALV